jgi:3-oxo-5alpha-steroid 4-dehydrogenase
MSRVSAWRFINPPLAWTKGIIVNGDGKRYVNETLYGAAIGEAMVEDNEGKAYLIIDKKLFKKSRNQVLWGRAQWFQAAPALLNLYFGSKKAGSIEELADEIGVPPSNLRETYESYREQVKAGAEDPYLKDEKYYYELDNPPFYAIDCSIDSKHFPCPTLTLGGLVIDEETGGVKDEEGEVISGLYAAGRTAVGICTRQYVSGLSIADCVYSGRRAARATAAKSGEQEAAE